MWPSVGYPVKKNEIKFTEIWEHSETEKAYLLKRLMMIHIQLSQVSITIKLLGLDILMIIHVILL